MNTQNIIILVAALIIVLAGVYFYLGAVPDAPTTPTTTLPAPAAPAPSN